MITDEVLRELENCERFDVTRTTLARELRQAREALRYYANRDNYRHARDEDGYDYPAPVEWEDDEGGRARACLPESQ